MQQEHGVRSYAEQSGIPPRLKKLLHKGMTWDEYEQSQRSRRLDPVLKKQLTCAPEMLAHFEEKQRKKVMSLYKNQSEYSHQYHQDWDAQGFHRSNTMEGGMTSRSRKYDTYSRADRLKNLVNGDPDYMGQHLRAQSVAGLDSWQLEQERQQQYGAVQRRVPHTLPAKFGNFEVLNGELDGHHSFPVEELEGISEDEFELRHQEFARLNSSSYKSRSGPQPPRKQNFPPRPSSGVLKPTFGTPSPPSNIQSLPSRLYQPKANAFQDPGKHNRSQSEDLTYGGARQSKDSRVYPQRSLPVDYEGVESDELELDSTIRSQIPKTVPKPGHRKSKNSCSSGELRERFEYVDNGRQNRPPRSKSDRRKSNFHRRNESSSSGKSPEVEITSPKDSEACPRQQTMMSWRDVEMEELQQNPTRTSSGITFLDLEEEPSAEEAEERLTFNFREQEWSHPGLDKAENDKSDAEINDYGEFREEGEEEEEEEGEDYGKVKTDSLEEVEEVMSSFEVEDEESLALACPQLYSDEEVEELDYSAPTIGKNGGVHQRSFSAEELREEPEKPEDDDISKQLTKIIEQLEENLMGSGKDDGLSPVPVEMVRVRSDASDATLIVNEISQGSYSGEFGVLGKREIFRTLSDISGNKDGLQKPTGKVSCITVPPVNAPQFVQCQKCDSVLPVPAGSTSRKGFVRLRCSKCFYVSKYADFGGGNVSSEASDQEKHSEKPSGYRRLKSLTSLELRRKGQDPKLDSLGATISIHALNEFVGRDQVMRARTPSSRSLCSLVFQSDTEDVAEDQEVDTQDDESEEEFHSSEDVWVNGIRLTREEAEEASLMAGPIEPGHYWYDAIAGFWGVIGGPCMGIIPARIPQFVASLEEDSANGKTKVWVNGRQLHEKDFTLLVKRGLSTETNVAYTVDQNGLVYSFKTGKLLQDLGKLQPSLERLGRGLGMYQPRRQAT